MPGDKCPSKSVKSSYFPRQNKVTNRTKVVFGGGAAIGIDAEVWDGRASSNSEEWMVMTFCCRGGKRTYGSIKAGTIIKVVFHGRTGTVQVLD